MIALSDNDATNACIDLVGMDYINSLMLSFGLPNTKLMRKMMDREAVSKGAENVSTPKELMTLMCKIHNRDGISEQIKPRHFNNFSITQGRSIFSSPACEH